MSSLLYDLCARLFPILARVGVGTNLGLLQIFFALVSGRFLANRGALVPALADCGLCDEAVRRSVQALSYGRWNIADLIDAWHKLVRAERHWRPHRYGGLRPVAVDLVGFFRAKLAGPLGKHYTSRADKALPALVFGMVASVGKKRLPILRTLLRQRQNETESDLQDRVLRETMGTLAADEVLVVDAGFGIEELLKHPRAAFVARQDQNVTARRNYLPVPKGSVGGANTGNGNKLTAIPIVSWTQRGGLPIDLTLYHNSEGNHDSELGQKWTFSFDLYLVSSGTGPHYNQSIHWGNDLSYQFTNSGR